MKKPSYYIALLLIALAVIVAYQPFSEAIRLCKFDAIKDHSPPMTTTQVENSLGQPAHIDSSETTGVNGQAYYYSYAAGQMKIVFINGTFFHSEYIPGVKS